MKTETSSDPQVHRQNIETEIDELIRHCRDDIAHVSEPRFQALLETTAEVLGGLKTAYRHYGEKRERAWGGDDPEAGD